MASWCHILLKKEQLCDAAHHIFIHPSTSDSMPLPGYVSHFLPQATSHWIFYLYDSKSSLKKQQHRIKHPLS